MFRNTFITLSSVIFFLGITRLSIAMTCGSEEGHSKHAQAVQAAAGQEQSVNTNGEQKVSEEAVNVGNKICPVSGEKIDEQTKATYEYEGKIYNFCCPMCIDEFKKDPAKYIRKVEEELRTLPVDQPVKSQ